MDGINLSAFFAGASTAFYAIFAAFLLRRRDSVRFHTVLGWILVVWAVLSLKDIIITFPQLYTPKVLNYISLIDGWSAVSYVIFVFEAVMPGWTTLKRVVLLLLPFLLFTLCYIVHPEQSVITAYYIFLWCFAWTIIFIAYHRARKYISYIRANYSNIDQIDVSWLRYVFIFAIVSQLSWLFTSIVANVLADAVYYISTVVMWLLVLYYSRDFRPIAIETMPEETEPAQTYPFADKLAEVMEQQALYLNADLTLNDLAAAIGTNRTYLSRYLSNVLGLTFYDYVNQLRLNKKSIPLMQSHPEYTLDYIATESGFKSISTFRRAFVKLTGQSPGSFNRPCP